MHNERRLRILVAALASLALVACSGPGGGSALPFEDDFSDDCEWPVKDDTNAIMGCKDDGYVIALKQPYQQIASLDIGVSVDAIRVSVDAATVDGVEFPREPGAWATFGLGCWVGEELGYVGEVDVNGTLTIGRFEGVDERFFALARGSMLREQVERGRLTVECSSGAETTAVALALDGEPVLAARDDRARLSFTGAGFSAQTTVGTLEARFDSLVAEELTEDEVAALEAQEFRDPVPAGLPLSEDFSERGSGWSTGENAQVELAYVDGVYRIRGKETGPWFADHPLPEPIESVAVHVTARWAGAPPGTWVGVSCSSSVGADYLLVAAHDYIAIVYRGFDDVRALLEAPLRKGERFGESVRLTGRCRQQGSEVELTLQVHDRGVSYSVSASDTRPQPQPFDAVGFVFNAPKPGTTVDFDDFGARGLP